MPKLEIGAYIMVRGRTYTLMAVEPYTRKGDSMPSQLLTWRATCAVCGTEYTTRTGAESIKPAVRCRPCADSGAPTPAQTAARDAFGARGRKQAAARRAAQGRRPTHRLSAHHVQDRRVEQAEAAGLNLNSEAVERWILYGGTMPAVQKIT